MISRKPWALKEPVGFSLGIRRNQELWRLWPSPKPCLAAEKVWDRMGSGSFERKEKRMME